MTVAKNKLVLFAIFYRSTLTLSIAESSIIAVLSLFNIQAMLLGFGVCFLSAGTIISLLYQEISKKDEYFFYYNKGLSKLSLFLACAGGNLLVGIAFITISRYA